MSFSRGYVPAYYKASYSLDSLRAYHPHWPSLFEAIAEAADNEQPLYVVTLDVQKAFDVVDYSSLIRKLYFNSPDLHSLMFIINNLQTEANVKLNGQYEDLFVVQQGVGQGKNQLQNIWEWPLTTAGGLCIWSTRSQPIFWLTNMCRQH